MESVCGVYLIRNTVNQKVYVGSSRHIPQRWKEHFGELSQGKHDNPKLMNAFRKYGSGAFKLEVALTCPPEELLHREQAVMDSLNAVESGYNLADRADRPPSPLGRKCSEEHRRHVSQSRLGKELSVAHREALRIGWQKRRAGGLGQHTEEFKAACGNRFRNKKQSAEHRLRKDAANREAARLHNPEWRRWAGRKGAAMQNGRPFDEPEPPLYRSKTGG